MVAGHVLAVFRSFRRDVFFSSLDIAGLAVGLAAALFIALYAIDELTFDAHLPDAEHVFRISSDSKRSGVSLSTSQKQLASLLVLDYPQITATTRLLADMRGVRHGDVETNETLYWADPGFFSVLSLPAVAGDPKAALANPAAAVITQRIARKYFGRDRVVGETLQIDRKYEVVVGAVLADLPSNTHLDTQILLSGAASFSKLRTVDIDYPGDFIAPVHTYFRVAAGTDVERLRREMPAFIDRHWPRASGGVPNSTRIGLTILPVRDIHLGSKALFSMRPAGDPLAVASLSLVALLIVLAACINFVNLTIARSTRRSLEVGIRKCNGAGRWRLAFQFAGEGVLRVGVAFLCAVLLVLALLPTFNALIGRDIGFRWMERPWLIGAMVPAVLFIGSLASVYPAAILSSFGPASVLRGGRAGSAASSPLRQTLIVAQFAILIGLLIATGTIAGQMRFAIARGTGVGEHPIVIVRTDCQGTFAEGVRQLPGVRAAACSQSAPTNYERLGTSVTRAGDGHSMQIDLSVVDFDFFSLYRLKPIAGRLFSRDHATDRLADDPAKPFDAPLILNETAVRKLGFASPAEAVGSEVRLGHVGNAAPSRIIGVVPDFPVESLREPIGATAYYIDPRGFRLLSIEVQRENLPVTLSAIDRAWDRTSGTGRPIDRFFIDDYLRDTYTQMRLQMQLFTALSVVAITIAGIGLFSMAALTAQRRTREIGIRKALGAQARDIVGRLTWEFAKPVLWANLIAWPVAEFFLGRWLETFAYHIEMPWWLFVACGATSLAIALAVVLAHAWRAARARAIYALRYE